MIVTVDIDNLLEGLKMELVNEWQHLGLAEKEDDEVYNMIVDTLAEFRRERIQEYQEPKQ